jgi:hypothetical protein
MVEYSRRILVTYLVNENGVILTLRLIQMNKYYELGTHYRYTYVVPLLDKAVPHLEQKLVING